MIVSNIFIGFGGSVQLSPWVVLGELLPHKARGLIGCVTFILVMPVNSFGPVVAESFIAHTSASWRWSYYLNIIVAAISIILMYFFYHPPTFEMLHVGKTRMQKIKALDYGGIILFMGGVILFLLGINWGGQLYPWNSAHVIVTIVVGFVTIVVFCFYEAYVPEEALIPLYLMKNLQSMLMIVIACVGGMIYYSMGILWPQIVGKLFTSDIVYQGWLSMATTAGAGLGNIVAGFTFAAIGKLRWQFFVASICMTAFFGAMASTTQHTKGRSVALAVLCAFSAGWLESPPNVAITFTLPQEDIGLAFGILSGIRVCFGGIATAIYSAIIATKSASYKQQHITPALISAGLPESSLPDLLAALTNGTAAALAAVPGMTEQIEAVLNTTEQDAFSSAVKTVFLVTIAFGSCGIICSWFIKNIDHLLTSNVSRKLHRRAKEDPLTQVENTKLDEESQEKAHVKHV